ncbi:MAG: glyoxalase/bleomycin resistance/dioxygenase family protein [Hyphomicrobiaceae bacterium]|nr:MAG: glyoxalase/bleomycin resistance/dioxygenase family protein [Hyphomicrobiaceae bacterium]
MAEDSVSDLIKRPHHTALSVRDFEAARRFYVDLLGFRVDGEMERRTDVGPVVGLPGAVIRWAMLARDGYRIELFRYDEPQGDMHPQRQCDGGYTHIAFEVRNVDEVYRRMRTAGYDAVSAPAELRGGASKAFYLRGPEGHVVEFIEIR